MKSNEILLSTQLSRDVCFFSADHYYINKQNAKNLQINYCVCLDSH